MSSCFLSNTTETTFLEHIKDNLRRCKAFAFSVSFIKKAGLVLLYKDIEAAVERGCIGRIITSTYQNFTDIESLQRFYTLQGRCPNFRCHLDYESFHDESYTTRGFHTKGYLFEFDDHNEVVIGSSNQEQKMCSTFLCIELFLSLLKHFGLKVQEAKENFDLKNLFADKNLFTNEKRNLTGLIVWAQEFTRAVNFSYINKMDEFSYVYCKNINGIILGCYRTILGFTKDSWQTEVYGYVPYQKSQDTKDYVHSYWKFLKVIN